MKRKLSLLLCLMLILSAASCGGETGGETKTTSSGNDSESTSTADSEYDFADINYGGNDFVFLNIDSSTITQSMLCVDREMTGDVLDDAIWKRSSTIEDMYNMKIVEQLEAYDQIDDMVRTTVLSGDDEYQVAFPLTAQMASLFTDGLVWNLNEGSGFQFDKPWWDSAVMSEAAVGSDEAIYFASSDISLHNFNMSWCMYFNRNMVIDHQLELPYDMVKQGKWTYDELLKYISVGHNLNGDASYAWNKDGKSVYGITTMQPDGITNSFVACGEKYISMNNGDPKLAAGSDHFYNVAEKLAKVYGVEGQAFFGNDRNNGSHYEMVFASGRSMFTACEIKGGNGYGAYSEMKDDYGIVPLPKLDENQENYISPIALWSYFMVIPKTNEDIETTSKILDTLAYLSYRDVVPAFYDVTLNIKNIRDEETTEMLDIIRASRTYDTAYAFGWGSSLRSSIASKIVSGSSDIASDIAAQKESTEAAIKTSLEAFAK